MEVKKICIFRSILGSSHVLTEDIEGYNVDWMSSVRGQSECVLKPRTTEEVSRILVALKIVTMFFCVASFSYLAVCVKNWVKDRILKNQRFSNYLQQRFVSSIILF